MNILHILCFPFLPLIVGANFGFDVPAANQVDVCAGKVAKNVTKCGLWQNIFVYNYSFCPLKRANYSNLLRLAKDHTLKYFPQFRVFKTLWNFGTLGYFWSEAFPLCDVFNIRCFCNEAFPEFDVFNISCWHDAPAPSFLITAPQIVPHSTMLRGVSVKMRISCSQNCQ